MSGIGNSVLGNNQFAYCFNNPVNLTDSAGNWPSWETIVSQAKKVVDIVVHATCYAMGGRGTDILVYAHYNRNMLNNDDVTEEELLAKGYKAEGYSSDKFHQNNQLNGERNRKYVLGDWFSSEIVYYSDGTINRTPEDTGTFNVYSGDDPVLNILVHGTFDVIPYMIWGNSPDDSTTIVDRTMAIWEN